MRYAYWTILIDDIPTAFRARNRDDLVPTLRQLQSKQPTAVLKWFARGRLWDSEEQARDAFRRRPVRHERRTREWRPGGEHRDPRARFKSKGPKRRFRPRPPAHGTPGAEPAAPKSDRAKAGKKPS